MAAERHPLGLAPPGYPYQSPNQQQLQPGFDPSLVKLTRGTSCVLCQQRKVRCDKKKPCSNCVRANTECRIVPPQPPRRRKKRMQEKDLFERVKKYESLLAQHGIKFDSMDASGQDHGGADDVDDLENDFEGLKTSPEASASPSASIVDRPHGTWFSLHREFRASEQLLHDSEDDEAEGSTIHRAYDKMFGNQDGFPFIIGGSPVPVTHYHPPPIQILQLWQIYIDNINPLLKITHAPNIQGQIIQATAQLSQTPKNLEALMFGVYLMAITSLDDDDVLKRFGIPKRELLGNYFTAVQQALINASFMRVNDLLTLQAFVLYLFAIRWFVDPRQVFCLTGIAVRIAQRMGLHRDPGGYGLAPFEIEQRRRLWWTLVGYDRRIGEMTGSTVTALSSGGDCKLPLNVNDSDLHMDGKEAPTPHTGPTEMLFALSRIELSMAVSSNSNRDSARINPEKVASSPQAGRSPGPTIRLAGQESPAYTLEGFCAHIEGTYLAHCDPKIPLHFFTLTMTRQALCKMRIINFLVRLHSADSIPMKDVERDNHFHQAIEMIEYDNIVQSHDSVRQFKWYSMHHFPFPAYMFLVQELRQRSSGTNVERAWEAITINHDLRGLINNLHNPMHTAFGSLFVKSWTAFEEAQRNVGKEMTTPYFISVLRERMEKRRRARLENRADPSLDQIPMSLPRSQGSDFTTSPETNMMTPPIDQSAGAGMMGAGMGAATSSPGEDTDMNWSYLMAEYQDAGGLQGFNPYGSFGNPMGGMGGGMGGFGGNMFG
ncbi:Aurofusarin cluster transcription factor aurR2 [Cladobotryum mycophilum]|uniref:Aurofusarin cluster transcription factor aurR2 n=1 Tax=Cladobotryum mycophilum TaxID=491253 RepID=A0ABR0T1P8_9HYPO